MEICSSSQLPSPARPPSPQAIEQLSSKRSFGRFFIPRRRDTAAAGPRLASSLQPEKPKPLSHDDIGPADSMAELNDDNEEDNMAFRRLSQRSLIPLELQRHAIIPSHQTVETVIVCAAAVPQRDDQDGELESLSFGFREPHRTNLPQRASEAEWLQALELEDHQQCILQFSTAVFYCVWQPEYTRAPAAA